MRTKVEADLCGTPRNFGAEKNGSGARPWIGFTKKPSGNIAYVYVDIDAPKKDGDRREKLDISLGGNLIAVTPDATNGNPIVGFDKTNGRKQFIIRKS